MTSDFITYEVQADVRSLDTNNFFIEFKKGKFNTSILTTESMLHMITNTKKYYLVETSKLLNLVFQNRIQYKKGITQDNSIGFLVPIADPVELSEVI